AADRGERGHPLPPRLRGPHPGHQPPPGRRRVQLPPRAPPVRHPGRVHRAGTALPRLSRTFLASSAISGTKSAIEISSLIAPATWPGITRLVAGALVV